MYSFDFIDPPDIKKWEKYQREGYISDYVYIKDTKDKGMGVFAKRDIPINTIIEYCHCLVFDKKEDGFSLDSKNKIYKYAYNNYQKGKIILPLGYGMIYNCGNSPREVNARYFHSSNKGLFIVESFRKILKDEEILLYWGDDYYNTWIKTNHKIY